MRKQIARNRTQEDRNKIQAWLAPLEPTLREDVLTPKGFPTPRGRHFMTAPTLPSSPSSASFSGEEDSSRGGSSCKSDAWQRSSVMTDVTEFDDLYGVSDEERGELKRNSARSSRGPKNYGHRLSPKTTSDEARKSLPQLSIPDHPESENVAWSPERRGGLKKTHASPVPPTPPSAVAMSPAMLSFMKAQHAHAIPTISAPPSLDGSLDGSLTSEQLAAMTAPATPVMAGEDPSDSENWAGVQLQPGAMETLQALSGPDSEDEMEEHRQNHAIEVSETPMVETHRPSRPRLITSNISRAPFVLSPAQQRSSLQDLTKLDIPSPGGFFSGLSPRSRTTWHYGTSPAEDIAPPTSTTAEQFYRVPWSSEEAPPMAAAPAQRPLRMTAGDYSTEPVEQIIEALESIKEEEDVLTAMRIRSPITAIRVPQNQTPANPGVDAEQILSPLSPRDENAVTEIVVDFDPEYAQKQRAIATSHIDRTELWLRAQFAYLRGVGFEPAEPGADVDPEKVVLKTTEGSDAGEEEAERAPTPPPKDGEQPRPTTALVRKKTVRFSSQVTTTGPSLELKMPCSLPSRLLKQESTYYRAFQSMIVKSSHADSFVSRVPRFEALQAQRISLREQHRAQLLGKYQLSVIPQSAKKRMSANVARGDDEIFEDPEKMRADKEAEALRQMATANWHVAATKMLNGGRLVCAPVHKRLARLSLAPGAAVGPKRLRILDLGGQSTCDWAWYAAHQYPNSKVYTVTTKSIRQLSNANVRGPPNHRQVAVTSLSRLPFADGQFDLVSARELHSILKNSDVADAEDEWDVCLREVMRVLKPGGYVDFSVMDSDIVNAGPLGLAKSVEFGFTLQTLGYDPSPTKTFLSRLYRAGFDDVRRGWVVLPLGPKPAEKPGPIRYGPNGPIDAKTAASQQQQQQPPRGGKTLCLNAMVTQEAPSGSTDGAAAIAGVAGTWSWEKWILRCEMEKAAGEMHSGFKLADTVSTDGGVMKEAGKSLDGVAAVVEEGRARGAGLRLLKGYARKPERRELDEIMGTIDMMLDF
ncbi:hypothetical protein M406DRAFT_280428 [Cryphonectria parasitica EP155]|uniref:Methyltransferase type 11 domain-containing protein n=1 Tax=Cryphonectria parasitica (strain ATCC 38755 / EP155) TaxID=660469 RepID=A0A9P5CM00_CRYP1|nr:uncharacterized protein M406DRAFT_280428 [Cryphonectria parasitica EP155]KAF3762350.1 hypothetical protein M406DRAFT_280428 [Cryphonectria parasitica EP155]